MIVTLLQGHPLSHVLSVILCRVILSSALPNKSQIHDNIKFSFLVLEEEKQNRKFFNRITIYEYAMSLICIDFYLGRLWESNAT